MAQGMETRSASQEMVCQGILRGSAAGMHAELAVDGLDMNIDRIGADEKPSADLLIG